MVLIRTAIALSVVLRHVSFPTSSDFGALRIADVSTYGEHVVEE